MTITAAQYRYLYALKATGDRGMTCHQLAAHVYQGNAKLTQARPSRRGSKGAGAAGALGNLAAGRMMNRLWTLGLVKRVDSVRYVITAAGAAALEAKTAEIIELATRSAS